VGVKQGHLISKSGKITNGPGPWKICCERDALPNVSIGTPPRKKEERRLEHGLEKKWKKGGEKDLYTKLTEGCLGNDISPQRR